MLIDHIIKYAFTYAIHLVIVLLSFLPVMQSLASDSLSRSTLSAPENISIEYLSPHKTDRNIKTINLSLYYSLTDIEPLNTSLYLNITGTYAHGTITQLVGDINQGTLHYETYYNSAVGIGPGLSAHFGLWHEESITVRLDASGNFILYNQKFPYGGDYYNFMWKGGPSIEFKKGQTQFIAIGYQWMHVSNGKGLTPRNPGYEAHGLTLQFSSFF